MFVLDTNVISELRKTRGRADSGVVGWVHGQSADVLFLSVVTVLELDLGVARVERRDKQQGRVLRSWLEERVLIEFADRVLPIDFSVARCAARLHVPDPRPERDALLAATAITRGMTVVTRNVRDFAGAAVINPWTSGSDLLS
jgi:predicted nucleic acid-binding protein